MVLIIYGAYKAENVAVLDKYIEIDETIERIFHPQVKRSRLFRTFRGNSTVVSPDILPEKNSPRDRKEAKAPP